MLCNVTDRFHNKDPSFGHIEVQNTKIIRNFPLIIITDGQHWRKTENAIKIKF